MGASWRTTWVKLGGALLALLILLPGCGPTNYKKDADEQVYRLIDERWDPAFGPRTNYRVSDVTAAPDAIQIQQAVPPSGVITLPYALSLATAHNRAYQTQKEALYLAALDQRLVRHGYETQLFGGGSLLYLRDGRDEAVRAEANVGFNRLLKTGALISTRVGVAWLDILAGSGNSGLAGIFSGTITQPLLRGRNPDIIFEDLTQAERNTLYQIRAFNRFRKEFVVSVASQYYRVLESSDLVQNARQRYEALTELQGRVEALVNVAILRPLELDRVRQERLGALDETIRAQKAYEQALDALKMMLALPPRVDFTLDAAVLESLKGEGIAGPAFDLDEAVETALVRRLDLVNRADAVLDAQRHVYVAADQLRAELNLVANVETPAWRDEEIAAGAIIDLPLDRVPEQHVYRRALIALNATRRDYDLAADTVALQVREAHRSLVEAAKRYQLAVAELALADERIEQATLLMQYGQESSRRVLDAIESLCDARNNATQALVNHVIATLEFYRDSGVLQVRPDGMWETGPLPRPAAPKTNGADGPAPAK